MTITVAVTVAVTILLKLTLRLTWSVYEVVIVLAVSCRCRVSLQNGDAKIFNDFLPELKTTVLGKGRANFWQEIVDGNGPVRFLTLHFFHKSWCRN